MRLWGLAAAAFLGILILPSSVAQPTARGTFNIDFKPARLEITDEGLFEVEMRIDAAIQCTLPWEPYPERLSANRTGSRNGSFYWSILNTTVDIVFTSVPVERGYQHFVNQTSVIQIQSRTAPSFNESTEVSFFRGASWVGGGPGECDAAGYQWALTAPPLEIRLLQNPEAIDEECDEVFGCYALNQAEPTGPAASSEFTGTSKVPQDAFAFIATLALLGVAVIGVLGRRARP